MTIKVLTITRAEFNAIEQLNLACRPKPSFGANANQIWISTRDGNTPESERRYIEGEYPIIDEIVAEYRTIRRGAGRFFIKPTEAYFHPQKQKVQRIVAFNIVD
jgi:hypothetical protein